MGMRDPVKVTNLFPINKQHFDYVTPWHQEIEKSRHDQTVEIAWEELGCWDWLDTRLFENTSNSNFSIMSF